MIFIGYPHRRRSVPFRLILPNLLTTVALCSGMASIHFSLKANDWVHTALGDAKTAGEATDALVAKAAIAARDFAEAGATRNWEKAIACIFIAAVFDMLDGRAARLLRAQSPFGAMLDSLSDFLCFGVAPAMLLHQWTLSDCFVFGYHLDALGLSAVMTFVLCSALRLARFTAAARAVKLPPGVLSAPEPKPHPAAHHFFVGMPTPSAAGAVLIPPMLAVSTFPHVVTPDLVVVLHTFLIAGLMIGRQPMFSFKRVRIPRRLVVPFLVLVGLVVVGFVKYPFLTGALLCGGYLLTTPFSIALHRRLITYPPRPAPTPLPHAG